MSTFSIRIREQQAAAAAAATAKAENDRRKAEAERVRLASTAALVEALAPLATAVDVTKERAALDAARRRLGELNGAARRVEIALDEELESDGDDSPRVAKRRARLEALRTDVAATERDMVRAEADFRAAAAGQLVALRDEGLRAVSAEGLEVLVDAEAREAAALFGKLAALAARAEAKVVARRADVERARTATRALRSIGALSGDDAGHLRDLDALDARRAVARGLFNRLPVGLERDAYVWLDTSDYGARAGHGRTLPRQTDDERAKTPTFVGGRHL